MLRIHCLQQWYALSDPVMDDALYEVESMRRFAGLELIEDAIPDETMILCLRRLLERHRLSTHMMNRINCGVGAATAVVGGRNDGRCRHSSPSTKNRAESRNPLLHLARPGFLGRRLEGDALKEPVGETQAA